MQNNLLICWASGRAPLPVCRSCPVWGPPRCILLSWCGPPWLRLAEHCCFARFTEVGHQFSSFFLQQPTTGEEELHIWVERLVPRTILSDPLQRVGLNSFYVRQNLTDEAVKHILYFNEYYEEFDWIWQDHKNPETQLNEQSIDHLKPQRRRSHAFSWTDELWRADEDNILNCLWDNSNSLVYIVLNMFYISNSWASQNPLKQMIWDRTY